MTEFSLKRTSTGNIEVNLVGTDKDLTWLVAEAMSKHFDTCLIISTALPYYCDLRGASRSAYAEQVTVAEGLRSDPASKYTP